MKPGRFRWLKTLSLVLAGLGFLMLADFYSGFAFLPDPFPLLPALFFVASATLLYPVFSRRYQFRWGRIRRVFTYAVVCGALMGLCYLSHALTQSNYTASSYLENHGQCAGLTRGLFRSRSDRSLFRSFIRSLSPMKQYLYRFAESSCRNNRLAQATIHESYRICKGQPDTNPYSCFRYLSTQGATELRFPAVDTHFLQLLGEEVLLSRAQSLSEPELDRTLDLIDNNLQAIEALQHRKPPQDWISSLKATPNQLEQRAEAAKRVDLKEWKKILLDFFLGKIKDQGEAALVFWADDEFARIMIKANHEAAGRRLAALEPTFAVQAPLGTARFLALKGRYLQLPRE